MMRNVFACVSDRSSEKMRHQKVKFGAPLSAALKNGYLPIPMVDLMVYVAREGINTRDIFRRPGNPNDTRRVVKRLSEGKPVIFSNYSFYTLASVVKKFLLSIPGGVFSPEGEETLLKTLTIGHKMDQYDAMHDYIQSCSKAHQQLLALLFGIWFTMVHNSHKNLMTTEALSRSVAGSMFHTCAMDPAKVEKASRILQLLIDSFGVSSVFGQENIQYFTDTTCIEIHVQGTFTYEYSVEDTPSMDDKKLADVALSRLHSVSCKADKNSNNSDQFHGGSQMLAEDSDKNMQELDRETNLLVTSTVSVPEVSQVPTPEITKRPKTVEDNLGEGHDHAVPKPCLGRYNSIKRKQLERLRQRSAWFLGPSTVSSHVIINTECSSSLQTPTHELAPKKNSEHYVSQTQSEWTVREVCSDGDSVCSEETRIEPPACEPALTNNAALYIHRDMLNSDTMDNVIPDVDHRTGNNKDIPEDEMTVPERMPPVWNKLPELVKKAPNVNTFKNAIDRQKVLVDIFHEFDE